jgi:hypothetical protein
MKNLDWEHYVAERLAERLEISMVKAQDLMYLHYSVMLQERDNGSTPNQAASALISL